MYITVLNHSKEIQEMITDYLDLEHTNDMYNVPNRHLEKFCSFCQDWDIEIDYCIHCDNTGEILSYEISPYSHYGLKEVYESCPYCGNGESAYDRYKDNLYD